MHATIRRLAVGSSRRWSRCLALLLAVSFCHAPSIAIADFTESEDSPFLDGDGSEDDPLNAPMPVPFDATSFLSAFPDGVKLVRGQLDAGDIDAYQVQLEPGDLALLAVFEDAAGELNDTSLGIFSGGAAPSLAENDDGGARFLSRLAFEVGSSGLFEVGVSGFGDTGWDGTHREAQGGLVPYDLVMGVARDSGTANESEPNDWPGSADSLSGDGAVVRGVLGAGDIDHYAIDLVETDRLFVSVFDLQSGSFGVAGGEINDAIVGLLDPTMTPAVGGSNDDGGPGWMPNLSFEVPVGQSGTWTIAVSGFGDTSLVGDHEEAPFDYLLVVARERGCANVPSLISGIVTSSGEPYVTENLGGGDHYYIDRLAAGRHVLVDVPSSLECSEWIRTANDDKNVSNPNHLTFSLSQDASVYVAYDTRATAEPAWLSSGFTPLGLIVDLADPDPTQEFDVLRRDFAAGSVVLGGNYATGAGSNYVVLARPIDTSNADEALEIVGLAEGGQFSVTIDGVIVVITTTSGQTAEQVADALAAAINADPTLSAARIFGLGSGDFVVTTGTIQAWSTTDPGLGPPIVPLGPVFGLGLVVALITTGVFRIRSGPAATNS